MWDQRAVLLHALQSGASATTNDLYSCWWQQYNYNGHYTYAEYTPPNTSSLPPTAAFGYTAAVTARCGSHSGLSPTVHMCGSPSSGIAVCAEWINEIMSAELMPQVAQFTTTTTTNHAGCWVSPVVRAAAHRRNPNSSPMLTRCGHVLVLRGIRCASIR
jgi:hypothetical protein